MFTSLRHHLLALLLAASSAGVQAGSVSKPEAGLDAIYGQASFGSSTIDIRFLPTQVLHNTSLLEINSDAEFDSLSDLAALNGSISVFYVDSIVFCGGSFNTAIVGCGEQPGNVIAVESAIMAGSLGDNILGHEMGHTLGLPHLSGSGNLMNGSITNSSFTLTSAQVAIILQSPLVQIDGLGQRFVNITPFAVVAVPEPGTWLLMALGIMLLGAARRRGG